MHHLLIYITEGYTLKRGILFLIILSLFFILVSCGKTVNTSSEQLQTDQSSTADSLNQGSAQEGEQQNSKPEDAAKPEKKPVGDFIFPTEGVRPFAVMIDNEGTRSLPQGGMYLAQVIYEVIVEGGETRLMPLFWGTNPTMIGPVRSSRHYFLDYSMEHDAIYVHFGGSYIAYRDLPKLKINNIDGTGAGGGIFWDLTKDRKNWQDSYTSMKKIEGYVSKVKYRTSTEKKPVFTYNKTDVDNAIGQKAEKINIRYSSSYTCGYQYDTTAKMYKRLRKGQPHMERVTGKQLEAKNIIIQYVRNYTIKGDTAGRQEVNTVGSGSGLFITNGKSMEIKWSKDARSSATKYTYKDGNTVMLNPGQTWVQIVPIDGKVEIN